MNHCFKIFLVCFLFIGIFVNDCCAEQQGIKFAVISDVRAGSIDQALEFIVSEQVDFILLPGDFCYDSQDYYSHFVKFGFEVKPELPPDQQNLYIVIGNHDEPPAGDDTFTSLIAPFYPKNGPVSSPEGTIFSFDRGNCHFAITNQYWEYPAGGYTEEQLDWIAQDLAESDQEFKFVVGHEPAFPLERHVGDSLDIDPLMRDQFWKILSENGFQAFFCGHTHHLSHILHKGVFQIDAGQVRSYQQDVTIVTVNEQNATIVSYETSDAKDLLTAANNGPEASESFHQTIAAKKAESSEDLTVLFEGSSADSKSGCFIGAARHLY